MDTALSHGKLTWLRKTSLWWTSPTLFEATVQPWSPVGHHLQPDNHHAYPLSRRDPPARNVLAFFLFFTMLFNGGLVPSYIMWTQTFHIKNTWRPAVPRPDESAFTSL